MTCSGRPLHSYNSCYAHNRAGRVSGSSRARATSSSGETAVRPPAERPSAAARCRRCPGRAGGRGGRHLRPAAAARCAAARAGQSRAAPLAGPRPPPIPPSASSSKAGPVGLASLLLQHRKSPPAISKPEGFFRQPRGGGRWHSISDAGPRTTSWGVIQQWQLMKDACL